MPLLILVASPRNMVLPADTKLKRLAFCRIHDIFDSTTPFLVKTYQPNSQLQAKRTDSARDTLPYLVHDKSLRQPWNGHHAGSEAAFRGFELAAWLRFLLLVPTSGFVVDL